MFSAPEGANLPTCSTAKPAELPACTPQQQTSKAIEQMNVGDACAFHAGASMDPRMSTSKAGYSSTHSRWQRGCLLHVIHAPAMPLISQPHVFHIVQAFNVEPQQRLYANPICEGQSTWHEG